MSLVVWLPLTKDLRQQGLSNVTVTNNGATFNSTGKLGGCYEFASGKRIQTTLPASTSLNTKAISFACWMYVTSWNSSYDCFMSIADGTSWVQSRATLSRNNTASTLTWNIADGTNRASVTTTTALPLNTWTHVAGTYDGTNLKIYINGVLNNTSATTLNIGYAGTFNVGGWSGNNYPFNGRLNDVRVYNHCLSPMEVKELAKGLILHYPLNRQGWGQENLVWDTHWDEISTKWSGWGSPSVREIVNTFGKKYLHVKSSDRWQGYSQNQAKRSGVGEITAGEKLTLSCWAYSNTTLTSYPCIGIHWTDGSSIIAQSWPLLTITTTPQKFITVLTVPNGVSAFNIMVGNGSGTVSGVYEIWVADVKLERGEKSTPWGPNSSDALATTMGLNSTTEYDCSGFCNNGEKIGTLTYTSDTPKYAVSTHLDATTTKIHISNFPTSGFSNSYTFAWWAKISSVTPMHWGFSDGIPLNGMYTGRLWNTGDGSNNPLYNIGTTTQVTAPTVNVWHHWVMTGNGTKCYVYQDGELWAEAKTYKSISGTSIYINGWANSTDYSSNNYSISDFRIYATALSASDVKSLYQNCATIDPDGTIRGQIRS